MNKLISTISFIVLCSYFSNPIQTAGAAAKHNHSRHATAKAHKRPASTPRHHARHHSRLSHHIARHHDGKHGTASWYGHEFQGKRTANGERYDMYAMTAAHNSLPLSSYVEVTNLKNKRSVIVRINDRGPFHGNRVIDLSYAAAKELGIQKAGTGSIEITPLVINDTVFQANNNPG